MNTCAGYRGFGECRRRKIDGPVLLAWSRPGELVVPGGADRATAVGAAKCALPDAASVRQGSRAQRLAQGALRRHLSPTDAVVDRTGAVARAVLARFALLP